MSSRKKLVDLRLTDLKHELEKRSLDTLGNKSALQNRLEEALVAEGNNPSEYLFNVDDGDDGRHNSENIVRNEAGDLLVHDDEEESDLLADSGGRRSHPNQDHASSLSPSHRMESTTSGANVTAGDDPEQNAANGDNGHEEIAKEATGGEDSRHLEDENEDELNRSREFIKSSKIPKETDEEKAKSCNLWVSNLFARVKAQDLTTLFAKIGPTDGAKVIISNRDQDSPFGFVTMATVEAADECIKQLDGTEWNSKNIKVEKIARDPTSSNSTNQNGASAIGESKSRRHSGTRHGGAGDSTASARRIAASDRRRLGAKGEMTAVSSTTEETTKNVDSNNVEGATEGAEGPEKNESEAGANKEKDIEYYKRKVRRNYDEIRELQATMERNRRRQNFLIQREREKASRIENQCRNSMRRERDLLVSERDLLDKRRSDLDRLEKALADRERMLKERERHLEEKDRDYMPVSRQGGNSSRPPTTLSASTYGPSQQSSSGRYYSNPPVSSSSAPSKRPYEGGSSSSSWENKRMNSRSDYPGNSDRQSGSQSYGQSSSYNRGNSSSGARGGRSGGRDYEDRGGYGGGDDSGTNSYSRAMSGSRGRRWHSERPVAGPRPVSGGVTSSSVAHWVKPVNHRPPFVGGGGSGDIESPGGDSSWSRGGGSSRRF